MCPEPFSETDQTDAPLWLRRYDIYADLKGWGPLQSLRAFPLFLRGTAAVWYDSLKPLHKVTFDRLKQAFKSRYFPHPTMRWIRLDEFHTRVQNMGESVQDYVQIMLKKGNDLEKTDKETMETMVKGFKKYIAQYVMEKEPKTLDETLVLARKAEAYRSTDRDEGMVELAQQIKDLKTNVTGEMASLRRAAVAAVEVNYQQGQQTQQRFSSQNVQSAADQRYRNNSTSIRGGKQQGPPFGRFSNNSPFQRPQEVPPYGRRNIVCYCCGENGHIAPQCCYRTSRCNQCGRVGHLSRMCRTRRTNSQ